MPFGGLSIGEMILIFAVLLLLFGPKRLPELASGVGKGIRDFKRSLNGLDERPGLPPQAVYPAQVSAAEPVAEPVPGPVQDAAAERRVDESAEGPRAD